MKIKTSEEIAHEFYTQPELSKFEEKVKFNKSKWVSISDLKREIKKHQECRIYHTIQSPDGIDCKATCLDVIYSELVEGTRDEKDTS